jgi:hypothetical protein
MKIRLVGAKFLADGQTMKILVASRDFSNAPIK